MNKNMESIIDYVVSGDFNGLLHYFARKECENLSITEISNGLKCSRRAVRRYLNNERALPFNILKRLLSIMEIDQELLYAKMSDQNKTYCSQYIPNTINGKIIWQREEKTLVNTLYIFRTQILQISFFQMAYKLEISPEKLSEYESGKVQIYRNDVQKILEALGIGLVELFPQLCSYDGDVSYLPLRASIIVENKDWDEFYINIDDEPLCLFQTWPINRYDSCGQPISNTMPNELSVNEYCNTDELFFLKDNYEFWEGPAIKMIT